jgi:transcription elongation factor GreA
MFGSTVTIENIDTEEQSTYTIVGTYESNPDRGLISTVTPLARHLMGKEEEDEVTVKLPSGEVEYEIISICYKEIDLS